MDAGDRIQQGPGRRPRRAWPRGSVWANRSGRPRSFTALPSRSTLTSCTSDSRPWPGGAKAPKSPPTEGPRVERPVVAFFSAGWCLPTPTAGIARGRAPQSVRAPVSGASLSPDSPGGVCGLFATCATSAPSLAGDDAIQTDLMLDGAVEQVRARGKRLTRSAVSVDSQITQGRVSGSGAGGGGAGA